MRVGVARDGLAANVLHDEVRLAALDAAVQQPRDAGVLEAREDLTLAEEPAEARGRDEREALERGALLVGAVGAFYEVHAAHAPAAEGAEHAPRPHHLALRGGRLKHARRDGQVQHVLGRMRRRVGADHGLHLGAELRVRGAVRRAAGAVQRLGLLARRKVHDGVEGVGDADPSLGVGAEGVSRHRRRWGAPLPPRKRRPVRHAPLRSRRARRARRGATRGRAATRGWPCFG